MPSIVYHTQFILKAHTVKLKILLGNCLHFSPLLQLSSASDTVSDIIHTHSCRDALNRLTGKVFISWLTVTWLPVDNIHRFISSFQQGMESATPQTCIIIYTVLTVMRKHSYNYKTFSAKHSVGDVFNNTRVFKDQTILKDVWKEWKKSLNFALWSIF